MRTGGMRPEPPNQGEQPPRAPDPDPHGGCCCRGLTEREAEELLDWLEAHGYSRREVSYTEGQGFTVRWVE